MASVPYCHAEALIAVYPRVDGATSRGSCLTCELGTVLGVLRCFVFPCDSLKEDYAAVDLNSLGRSPS